MGKYTNVTKDLPRVPQEKTEFQVKVDQSKLKLKGLNLVGIAERYVQLKLEKNALEAQIKELNIDMTAVEQLGTETFESEGADQVRLSTGTLVSLQLKPYAGVEDKEAYRLWCLENGLEHSMQLPWQTTNAMVCERLLAGEPNPPGVTAYCKPTFLATGINKSKK